MIARRELALQIYEIPVLSGKPRGREVYLVYRTNNCELLGWVREGYGLLNSFKKLHITGGKKKLLLTGRALRVALVIAGRPQA